MREKMEPKSTRWLEAGSTPGRLFNLIRNRIVYKFRAYQKRKVLSAGKIEDVFTEIYNKNYWHNDESVSGDGSTLTYTANIRSEIPRLIRDLKIKRILDAPCGDYNWFRSIDRDPPFSYIGADIVDELVERNQTRFGNENTQFLRCDITAQGLPPADLWLCRDALFHFSNRDIFRTLYNFFNNDINFILTSSHPECKNNSDISTGDFRLLNLEIEPFFFPRPVREIKDWVPGFPVRYLGLWDKDSLERTLNKNVEFIRFVEEIAHPSLNV